MLLFIKDYYIASHSGRGGIFFRLSIDWVGRYILPWIDSDTGKIDLVATYYKIDSRHLTAFKFNIRALRIDIILFSIYKSK